MLDNRLHSENSNVLMIFFFLFFLSTSLYSTPQIPNKLIIEKDTFDIYTNYNVGFELNFIDSIIKTNDQKLDKKIMSNCFRGYVATFKIINDSLLLVDLMTCSGRNLMEFKDKSDEIFFKNMTGDIRAGEGFLSLGFYLKEIHVTFINGISQSKKIFDYKSNYKSIKSINKDLIDYFKTNLDTQTFKKLFKKNRHIYLTISSETGKVKSINTFLWGNVDYEFYFNP